MNQAQPQTPSPEDIQKLKGLIEQANIFFTSQRLNEAKTCLEEILSIAPENISAIEMLAIVEHNLGNKETAIDILEKALVIPVSNARIYNTLGHFKYFLKGDIGKAKEHYLKAISINPGLAPAYKNLGGLYLKEGDWPKSVESFANAVIHAPKNLFFMQLFAQSLGNFNIQQFNPGIKTVLGMCLEEDRLSHRYLTSTWLLTIDYDPLFKPLHDIPFREEYAAFAEEHDLEKLIPVLNDPFLLLGLRRDYLSSPKYELIFTAIRRLLLSKIFHNDWEEIKELAPFIQHLALQSWLNEYVFSVSDEEDAQADALQKELETNLQDTDEYITKLSILACYKPLHKLNNLSHLLDLFKGHDDKTLQILFKMQITDPLEEEKIKKTIPVHGTIDNKISQDVQSQYEENPYPRWKSIHTGKQRVIEPEPSEILVAGCGTGQQPASLVPSYPQSQILCVDLSLSSLAYAIRQCRELDITQLTFKQADILQLGTLGKQFDTIHCNGVLHHMEDPEAGLKVLISLLKPGGTMHLSLYSEVARPHVVATRAYIKEQGLRPTVQNIRRLREIAPHHPDELIRLCAKGRDFYTTSQFRDLVFHVQEHRYTIEQLKDMFKRHNMSFLSFYNFSEKELHQFKTRFPEENAEYDMDKWKIFEEEQPAFFLNKMYTFKICHKADFEDLREID